MDRQVWSRELRALSRKASRRAQVAAQIREVGSRADAMGQQLGERSVPRGPRRSSPRGRRGLWLALGLQGPMLLALVLVARVGPERSAVAAVMPVDGPPPTPERVVEPAVPPATVTPPAEVAASSEAAALAEADVAEVEAEDAAVAAEVPQVVEQPALPPAEADPVPPSAEVVGAVEVASLPFVHQGDTRTSTERRIDTYGCAPNKPERGPEVWYRLTVAEPGRLTASIREDKHDGVDVDLHLLASVEASSCIARDNERLDALVEVGTYWLVLDTFGDRLQKPGPYRLDVRVEPEG